MNISTNISITSLNYSHLSIIIIFAVSIVTLGNWGLQQVNAQNATNVNFVTYENPSLGFSIKHPADWKGNEITGASAEARIVTFKPSDETSDTQFTIYISNVTQYLDTDTLTLKNTTLRQSAKEWQNVYSLLKNYKPLRQNDITIAGNVGLKMEYLLGDKYGYDVFTIIDGKLYHFTYEDTFANVPKTVQLANKMVESFQIIK